MKKIIFVWAILLACFVCKGQTVEFVAGTTQRVFVEKTDATENATTFAYLEATYNGGALLKVFREQKYWKAPVFIHAEYQTTFNGNHTAIVGPSYTYGLPTGFLSFGVFYHYDTNPGEHAVQASFCYLWNWKRLELYGYNHFWQNSAPCFFGENRAHISITDHFKVGAILDLTYFGEFGAVPYLGIRYDF